MKGEWPADSLKNAKQLGGQANAARGQPIIWIIGANCEERKVVTPAREELATWWPQAQKHFDDQLSPMLVADMIVPVGDTKVVVLYFETDRAPYVIKEGDRKYVPWREGTRTVNAGRQQLVRLLVPMVPLPAYEVFGGVTAFLLPRNQETLYIARHRCSLRVRFPAANLTFELPIASLGEEADDPGVDEYEDYGWDLMPVEKPLKLEVYGSKRLDTLPTLPDAETPEVDLTVGLTTTDVTTKLTAACGVETKWSPPPSRRWQSWKE